MRGAASALAISKRRSAHEADSIAPQDPGALGRANPAGGVEPPEPYHAGDYRLLLPGRFGTLRRPSREAQDGAGGAAFSAGNGYRSFRGARFHAFRRALRRTE